MAGKTGMGKEFDDDEAAAPPYAKARGRVVFTSPEKCIVDGINMSRKEQEKK
jgi:hypothetical protein